MVAVSAKDSKPADPDLAPHTSRLVAEERAAREKAVRI